MNKFKHIFGNLLFQTWIVAQILLIYLIYRIVNYRDINSLIFLIISYAFQMTITNKSSLIVNIIQYFQPMKLFKESKIIELEKPKSSNAMFCFHPHGVYSYTLLAQAYTKNTLFEHAIILGSRVALFLPISGIILRLYGIQGVDPENFQKHLKEGQNIAMLPGGFEEATLTTRTENRVYLKRRKGFIKYALKYGTTIYPVFVFGENQLFYTFDKLLSLRLWLNKYKMVGTIFWSRFLTFPEPNTCLYTVCGRGINIPKVEQPSKSDIDKYHQLYIEKLQEFYDQEAPKYQPKVPLKIY